MKSNWRTNWRNGPGQRLKRGHQRVAQRVHGVYPPLVDDGARVRLGIGGDRKERGRPIWQVRGTDPTRQRADHTKDISRS